MRKKYLYCYNRYLLKYLTDKGFAYVSKAMNHNTNTEFYLFERTNELTNAMDEYEQIKHKRQS